MHIYEPVLAGMMVVMSRCRMLTGDWWTDQVVSTKVTAAATNNHRGAHLTLHVVTMFLSVYYYMTYFILCNILVPLSKLNFLKTFCSCLDNN